MNNVEREYLRPIWRSRILARICELCGKGSASAIIGGMCKDCRKW